MLESFTNTLTPVLSLFLCIAIGFILKKAGLFPDNASKTMAKLEYWVFCPALSFATLLRFCTVDNLGKNATTLGFALVFSVISVAIAIPCAKLFVPKKEYERGIYTYALAFGNLSYMGDPLALAMYGSVGLAYYKMFTLPLLMLIYTWGISLLIPKEQAGGNTWKSLLNPSMVASFSGILLGIVGLGGTNGVLDTSLPFLMKTVDSLSNCMGPVAMLLAGFTIASYDLKKLLTNKKVYIATALRLVILPVVLVGCMTLVRFLFHVSGNGILFIAFLASAVPLGMNTIVFPEAYGGNPETGASMATISHSLCVITIPVLFTVMTALFGAPAL